MSHHRVQVIADVDRVPAAGSLKSVVVFGLLPVLKVVSKRWGAELAMDDRVAGCHEGVGSGEAAHIRLC